MARLITSGGEIRDHSTTDIGSPDGFTVGTAATTTETTTVRSGSAAIKCPGTSTLTAFRAWTFTAPAAGVSLFARFYFRVSALPNATKKIARFGTTAYGSVRLTSAGKLQLWNDTGTPAQIGSDSALTVAVDTWYRVELKQTIGTGATDALELRAKQDGPDSIYPLGIVAAGSSLSLSDTQPVRFEAGWIDAPGVTSTMYLDDISLNDSTGTKQNSWPGDERIGLLLPTGGTLGSGWLACDGSSVAARGVAGLANTPPLGLAEHSDAGHTTYHQARHQGSIASTLTATFSTFGGAGISGNILQEDTAGSLRTLASTTPSYAQAFKLAGTLGAVDLYLKRTTPSSTVYLLPALCELRADSGGLPAASVLASATVPILDVPTTNGWVRFSFAHPLTPGEQYWIVLTDQNLGANVLNWTLRASGATDYVDGYAALYDAAGEVWTTSTLPAGIDLAFRAFSAEGFAPLTVVQPVACTGEGDSTGTKTGSVETDQNPVTTAKAFDYGNNVGACGTYPTNWRWALGNIAYEPPITNAGSSPRALLKRTDTTSRFAGACFLGVLVGFRPVETGWRQVTKTGDSTLHWIKQAPNTMTMAKSDDTEVTATSGDFFITPDPLPDDGSHTTLSTITIATLQADYTGW